MWTRRVRNRQKGEKNLSGLRFRISRDSRYDFLRDNAVAEVQASLNIKQEGSQLLIIKVLKMGLTSNKNPVPVSDPETAGRMWRGLSPSSRAQYAEDLQKIFEGRR